MTHSPGLNYRPDIDGLRAVAVLSVLICHADLGLTGGFVGVDVFFVISGYLITTLICKDLEQGKGLSEFWERRIRRILPALVVVVGASVVLGKAVLRDEAFIALGYSVAAVGALVSNFYFWRTTGYFELQANEKPLLHTWSLAVEEQFYLLMPLGLWLLARYRLMHRLTLVLTVIAIASLALSIYGTAHSPSATFYLLPTRAWEFLAGSLLSRQAGSLKERSLRLREWISTCGLLMILFPCGLYDRDTRFPGLAALPPVLGTVMVIWSGSQPGILPAPNRLLAHRLIVSVGLISYSLYLWHWPLFVFAQYRSFTPLTTLARVGLLGLSILVGFLSWRYVESPIRKRHLFHSRQRMISFAAGSLIGLVACGGLVGWKWKGKENSQASTNPELLDPNASWSQNPRYFRELELTDIPHRIPGYGAENADPQTLVWGDSHAMSILPAIEALGQEHGLRILAATHSSTAPVLDFYAQSIHGLNERAIPYNAAVMNFIRTAGIRRVALVGFWEAYGRKEPEKFIKAMMETVKILQGSGIQVFFVKDVPRFKVNPARTFSLSGIDRSIIAQLSITTDDYESQNRLQSKLIPLLQLQRVVILDPVPKFQEPGRPEVLVPADVTGSYYSDEQHLSTYGALAIRDIFLPLIPASPDRGNSQE